MADADNTSITVDGKKYNLNDLSDAARAKLQSIVFCNEQIQQLSNEWAVADTARLGYTSALKREVTGK